jgi:hypothetical protein
MTSDMFLKSDNHHSNKLQPFEQVTTIRTITDCRNDYWDISPSIQRRLNAATGKQNFKRFLLIKIRTNQTVRN